MDFGKPLINPKYIETVVVSGDVMKYFRDLEGYFSDSALGFDRSIGGIQKRSQKLERDIGYCEGGISDVWWDHDNYGCDFTVDRTNYEQARQVLKQKQRVHNQLLRSQLINRRKIQGVLFDDKPFSDLDIFNYANPDTIIRIQARDDPEKVFMDIFWDIDCSKEYPLHGKGFVMHVDDWHALDEVEAEIVRRNVGCFEIPKLEDYVSRVHARGTGVRVKTPKFDVHRQGSNIVYSCQLSKQELEVLREMVPTKNSDQDYTTVKHVMHLKYEIDDLSPGQLLKTLRHLYGILSIDTRGRSFKSVGVEQINVSAVQTAFENQGLFVRSVETRDLSVLGGVFNRANNLRERYGSSFYPRFTDTEAGKLVGISKRRARASLERLTGVLTKVYEPKLVDVGPEIRTVLRKKWFLSKARQNLAWRVLNFRD